MTAALAAAGALIIAALGDLTVPADRLPAGCAPPASATERMDDTHFRGGLWAALPISRNPQASPEPNLIVEVRERLGGAPLLPDAPGLTALDAARFRLKLADGIDEAYAAIYRQADSFEMVVVYGLRFPDARAAAEFWSTARAAKNPRVTALVSGTIVAALSGPPGACYDAVAAYLNSLP